MNSFLREVACIGVVGVVAASPAFGSEEASVCIDRLAISTTNSWGRSIDDFRAAANSNMTVLAQMRMTDAEVGRENWLISLMSLPVPTNSYVEYRLWISEKSSWLFGAGRSFGRAENTNLWLSAASAIGSVRQEMKTRESLLERVRAESVLQEQTACAEGRIAVSTGFPDWYFDEVSHLIDQEKAIETMLSALIEHFAKRGMRHIPAQLRWHLYADIVEKASLNASECQRLRDAIR